MSKAVLTF